VIHIIIAVNLSTLDLNQLLVLHAVLEERSATRAARRLNVTQSAVSNALARLRQTLGDSLVVRSGRGLVPTPRAAEIQPLLTDAMARLEQVVDQRGFVAAESTRTFTIALADNDQVCEGPRIAAACARRLPRAALRIVSADYLVASNGLATGDVDVAFVPEQAVLPGQPSTPLFEQGAVLLVRRGHPQVRTRITRELFNALRHVNVEVALGRTGEGHRVAEAQWQAQGLRRQVVLTVPYFMTAALAAATTDLVVGLPERLARLCCELLPLRAVTATFPLPRVRMAMVWHQRTDADPGARYFREMVAEAVRTTRVRAKAKR
jgi:DNA-binding transcriptional LysR family regulator